MKKTKVCFKCDKRRPLKNFYRHPQTVDGHLGKCKECAIADVKTRRLADLDRVQEFDRVRGRERTAAQQVQCAAVTKEWRRRNGAKVRAYNAAHYKSRRAMQAVHRAVQDGCLKKPAACEACGKKRARLEGHHDDYDKPLEVRWLCSKCHKALHVTKRNEARSGATE